MQQKSKEAFEFMIKLQSQLDSLTTTSRQSYGLWKLAHSVTHAVYWVQEQGPAISPSPKRGTTSVDTIDHVPTHSKVVDVSEPVSSVDTIDATIEAETLPTSGSLPWSDEGVNAADEALAQFNGGRVVANGNTDGSGSGRRANAIAVDRIAHLRAGDSVGDYVLTPGRREGAAAVVVFAMDALRGREVALKFFARSEDYQRELDAYRALGAYAPEALPEMYERFPETEELPAIIAYEKGSFTLEEYLRKQRPDDFKKKSALYDILLATQVLHKKGIVHNDIKPANVVFFSGSGSHTFKLVDIGSWVEEGARASPTYTLKYCAPEVLSADLRGRPYTARPSADVFCIGVYEVLSGHRFYGDDAVHRDIVEMLMGARPLPTDEGQGKLAIPLQERKLVQGMLSRNPKTRLTLDNVLNSAVLRDRDDSTFRRNITSLLGNVLQAVKAQARDLNTGALMISVHLEEVVDEDKTRRGGKLTESVRKLLKFEEVLMDTRSYMEAPVFKMRIGRTYKVVVTVQRQQGAQPLPVRDVQSIRLSPAGFEGDVTTPELEVEERTQWLLRCSGIWRLSDHRTTSMSEPTKNRGRPAGETVAVDLVLELGMEPDGETMALQQEMHLEMYPSKEKFALGRAFKQGKEFWDNAPPWAKAAAKGIVIVAKAAAK